MGWDSWWLWIAGGLVIGILEVVMPIYVFLGFAIGALGTGLLLAIGGVASSWFAGSPGMTLLVFGLLSLAAWALLRLMLGVRSGQRKVWDRDIND